MTCIDIFFIFNTFLFLIFSKTVKPNGSNDTNY